MQFFFKEYQGFFFKEYQEPDEKQRKQLNGESGLQVLENEIWILNICTVDRNTIAILNEDVDKDVVTGGDCNTKPNEIERSIYSQISTNFRVDEKVPLLYSAWSDLLTESKNGEGKFSQSAGLDRSNVPKAPHLDNCKLSTELSHRLENASFPPRTIWKGMLNNFPVLSTDEQLISYRHQTTSKGVYPPWHTLPKTCKGDPSVIFLVADWERLPRFGMDAQFAGMCGLLAIAMNENRALVTNYYNRADHDACEGPSRSSWSCYFFPETSDECHQQPFELLQKKEAWEKGIITGNDNYTSKEIWDGPTPRQAVVTG
ncbi:unnamed protein product [Ilex paraguariensis]|uniref:Uncharacterized protein n=1 Tax=Ilex paraguariensis TaxID=185542 RepID=A0ABC8UUT3_9AQUA